MTRTSNLQSRLSKVGRKIKYAGTAKTVKIASQTLTGSPLSTHSLRTSEFKKNPTTQNNKTKQQQLHKQTKSPPKTPKNYETKQIIKTQTQV